MKREIKQPVFAILGMIALLANLATLYQFFAGSIYLDFWNARWVLSICFIVGLFAFGLFLLRLSLSSIPQEIMGLYAGIYLLSATLMYLMLAFKYETSDFGLWQMIGFLSIMAIILFISLWCASITKKPKYYLYSSYLFGTANLIVIVGCVVRYLFLQADISNSLIALDAFLIALGGGVFMMFYKFYRRSSKLADN